MTDREFIEKIKRARAERESWVERWLVALRAVCSCAWCGATSEQGHELTDALREGRIVWTPVRFTPTLEPDEDRRA